MRKFIDKILFSGSAPAHTKPQAVFATISIFIPLIAFLIALGVQFVPDPDSGHMGLRDIYWGIAIMFFSFIGGTLSGFIALARREKRPILISAGLLLNGCPLLLMLAKIVFHD